MSKLIDFEDTQAAIFLLRLSFGILGSYERLIL